jgi:hypothetical protein
MTADTEGLTMTEHATDETTTEPQPEPEPEPTTETTTATTTEALAVAAEVHARIAAALAALSDAAELAAESSALPDAIEATVLRALSHAHRYVSDAYVLTTVQAVGAAQLVQMTTPADASRRVICSCGLAFTPAGWELHTAGLEAESPEGEHTQAGQLVAAGPRNRRRVLEVLLAEDDEHERGRG